MTKIVGQVDVILEAYGEVDSVSFAGIGEPLNNRAQIELAVKRVQQLDAPRGCHHLGPVET